MPDPFLRAHLVGPYWADIGGRLSDAAPGRFEGGRDASRAGTGRVPE